MGLFSKRFDEFYLLDGRLKNIQFSAVKDHLGQKQHINNRYKSHRLFSNLIKMDWNGWIRQDKKIKKVMKNLEKSEFYNERKKWYWN